MWIQYILLCGHILNQVGAVVSFGSSIYTVVYTGSTSYQLSMFLHNIITVRKGLKVPFLGVMSTKKKGRDV